jgi:hypothetical protein
MLLPQLEKLTGPHCGTCTALQPPADERKHGRIVVNGKPGKLPALKCMHSNL